MIFNFKDFSQIPGTPQALILCFLSNAGLPVEFPGGTVLYRPIHPIKKTCNEDLHRKGEEVYSFLDAI